MWQNKKSFEQAKYNNFDRNRKWNKIDKVPTAHLTAAVKLQNRDNYTAYDKSMHTTQALLNYLQRIKIQNLKEDKKGNKQ